MIVSCVYGIDPENSDFEAIMRNQRDRLLADSDWTQLPNCPLSDGKKAEWATYRQQLRDFPATWTPAPTAEFPEAPQ
jgi:hypothetical protein